jgi:hypothetical protein
MTSELSTFAARVRDFIGICAEDFSSEHHGNPDFQAHADIEFNGLALMLFTLQFAHNPAYRKICQARKVSPESVSHWTGIPAVPTSAFKDFDITCLLPEQRTVVFHSSGTTAQKPSRHYHSAESLSVYEASLLAWFRPHVQPGGGHVILTPSPLQAPNSSLVHMFETIRRDFDAADNPFFGKLDASGGWTVDFESAVHTLQNARIKRERITVLGTAFSFVHLLDYLTKKNLRLELPSGSRLMETGGYKNRSRSLPKGELHALMTERLGVPASHILCEYGMSELSSQAYHRGSRVEGRGSNADLYFHFPPWVRVQVISPETGREVNEGETGLLRVYDLANVFSSMAIQTEDLAAWRRDGFELLGRAELAEPRGCSLMAKDQ